MVNVVFPFLLQVYDENYMFLFFKFEIFILSQVNSVTTIDLASAQDLELFNNGQINRRLPVDGIKEVLEDLASRGNFEWSDKSKRSEMEIEFRDHLVKDLLQSVRVIMWLLLWLTHTQFTGHFDNEDN